MNQLMLDIETMGNTSLAPVISIAGVYFDYNGETGTEFYRNITLESCYNYGYRADYKTIEWWLRKSKEAQDALFQEPRVDLKDAMYEFFKFQKPSETLWCHSSFDFPIVTNIINNKFNFKPNIPYIKSRDIRTIIHLAIQKDPEFKSVIKTLTEERDSKNLHHNANADCKFQIIIVSECMKILSLV